MSYFPRAGHASSPASVRSLELGAGTVRSAPGQAVLTHLPPRPLSSRTAASAWGSQGPPGPRHEASPQVPWSRQPRPAASQGCQHLLLTREGAGPRGRRGGARRPSEGWRVHVGLGPGLQGEGRAADVDAGARSTHPGSRGAQGCVHVSPHRVLVGRRASPEAPPPHGGGRLRSGGSSQTSPPLAPGRAHSSPRGRPVVTGSQGRLSCKAWPQMPCPHCQSCLAWAWGCWHGRQHVSAAGVGCGRVCVCVCLFSELFSSRGYNSGIVFSDHKYNLRSQ